MNAIQNISSAGYAPAPANSAPKESPEPESNIDTYTPSVEQDTPQEEPTARKMTQETAEMLSQKYDLRNMDRNQYSKLLAELRDAGIITAREYSAAYGGTLPQSPNAAPQWPYGGEEIDFVHFLDTCVKYCEDAANDPNLTAIYTKLSGLFGQIDQARHTAPEDTVETEQEPDAALQEQYSDEVIQLYKQLKADENWTNTSCRLSSGSSVAETARQLAKELLLSDNDLLDALAKDLWIQRAKHNQECIADNEPERVLNLPKDYREIADTIKRILNGTAGQINVYGDRLISGLDAPPLNHVYSALDTFLVHKAEREPLTDVERLVSKDAARTEKYIWQTFDGQMKDTQNKINSQLGEDGFNLDIDKEYQFYLNSDFTFTVKGGTTEENARLESLLNTHPRENYKFDPLHEMVMALYFSRPDSMGISPWRAGTASNELLEKYGIASGIPDSYTQKMKQLLPAYEWHKWDRNLKYHYGFGVDDIYVENGKLFGRTDEVTKLIEKLDENVKNQIALDYMNARNEYRGTPEFSEPVFIFKDGKFQLTYENI